MSSDIVIACPQCGTEVRPTKEWGGLPKEGDVAVCIPCGAINIFTEVPGRMRVPTVEELDNELKSPQTQQIIRAAADERRRRIEEGQ